MAGTTASQDLVNRFAAQGYVLLPGFVAADDLLELRSALDTTPERDPGDNPLTLGNMRFASNLFYASGQLQQFLCSSDVVAVISTLLGPDVWVRWDQAVWKGPGAPTFPWHQDNGYTGLPTMHLQLWLALTEMNQSNGGLRVAPGAHRVASEHRYVGHHVEMNTPDHTVAVDAAPGDVIIFSSYLPHSTAPNSTGVDRLAYVAEFLPVSEPDSSVAPPHFVVATAGTPDPHFTDLTPGWSS